jgi:hypothetical protein
MCMHTCMLIHTNTRFILQVMTAVFWWTKNVAKQNMEFRCLRAMRCTCNCYHPMGLNVQEPEVGGK